MGIHPNGEETLTDNVNWRAVVKNKFHSHSWATLVDVVKERRPINVALKKSLLLLCESILFLFTRI